MDNPRKIRVGSVSYLNAKPLIFGLEKADDLELRLEVPARLSGGLADQSLDIALLPVIDYPRLPNLKIVPSGGIGSDGETLTVRIFSPRPLKEISTLACDQESHTSVALARIVLAETYGLKPALIPLDEKVPADAARLLIGDKVVTRQPKNMPHQLDLGAAWKELTGLPFVFAVWTARGGVDLRDLPTRLEMALKQGLANLPTIIAEHAVPTGWPREVAMRYLTHHLKFQIGPRELQAIGEFHQRAWKAGIIPEPRNLEMI